MTFHAILAGPNQPNIGAIDALLTACGHTPLRDIKQHYDAEQGCWCVTGEVKTMNKPIPTISILDSAGNEYTTGYDYNEGSLVIRQVGGDSFAIPVGIAPAIIENLDAILDHFDEKETDADWIQENSNAN